MAAHVSRSVTLTEWMDASIVDELDIGKRNVEFNLYDSANPNRAPYNAEFLARYRAAQIARNRRITDWVKTELAARIRADGPGAERGFVVHGTMADPRWLDATVDPNDREPGTCYLGDPRIVNMGPVGLARFCTLRSWLSQWSFDESRANGIKNAQNVTCPVLVIGNTADNACTPSHTHRLYRSRWAQGQGVARDQGRDALLCGPAETLRRGHRRVFGVAVAQGILECGAFGMSKDKVRGAPFTIGSFLLRLLFTLAVVLLTFNPDRLFVRRLGAPLVCHPTRSDPSTPWPASRCSAAG